MIGGIYADTTGVVFKSQVRLQERAYREPDPCFPLATCLRPRTLPSVVGEPDTNRMVQSRLLMQCNSITRYPAPTALVCRPFSQMGLPVSLLNGAPSMVQKLISLAWIKSVQYALHMLTEFG